MNYIDNLISLAKNNPEKIKLLPNSKLIYISKKYDNFEKVLELKKFLESLINMFNKKKIVFSNLIDLTLFLLLKV